MHPSCSRCKTRSHSFGIDKAAPATELPSPIKKQCATTSPAHANFNPNAPITPFNSPGKPQLNVGSEAQVACVESQVSPLIRNEIYVPGSRHLSGQENLFREVRSPEKSNVCRPPEPMPVAKYSEATSQVMPQIQKSPPDTQECTPRTPEHLEVEGEGRESLSALQVL